MVDHPEARANAAYIAACSPDRMREVLYELYALRETALQLEAMQREMAELRHIGSQMANVLHHWKQRKDIPEDDRKQMAALQEQWDAAPTARTLIQGEKP